MAEKYGAAEQPKQFFPARGASLKSFVLIAGQIGLGHLGKRLLGKEFFIG